MASIVTGATDVPTAGTAVQINDTPRRILSIIFKGRDSNAGKVYVGTSSVTASTGFELKANQTIEIRFVDKRVSGRMSDFYVNAATNGDDVDWLAVIWP